MNDVATVIGWAILLCGGITLANLLVWKMIEFMADRVWRRLSKENRVFYTRIHRRWRKQRERIARGGEVE